MKIELLEVAKEQKEILRNLLEKYDYEFSQYDMRDVNDLGLYGYELARLLLDRRKLLAVFLSGQMAGWPDL